MVVIGHVYFVFSRYKLRKHCSTVHKGSPLMYTNHITGENCVGRHINYANAILTTTPAHYNHETRTSTSPGVDTSSSHTATSSQSTAHEETDLDGIGYSDLTEDIDQSDEVSDGGHSNWDDVSLFCPKCTFNTYSEQELLAHFIMHSQDEVGDNRRKYNCVLCTFATDSADEFNDHHYDHVLNKPYECGACSFGHYLKVGVTQHIEINHPDQTVAVRKVSPTATSDESSENLLAKLEEYQHLHPEVELRNFLQLPIELLHAFMVQNGLSEIHQ